MAITDVRTQGKQIPPTPTDSKAYKMLRDFYRAKTAEPTK